MNVKNVFLNGVLTKKVYMQPPHRYDYPPHKVCHLRQALYGLKQTSRLWFAKFSSTTQLNFIFNPHDSTVFISKSNTSTTLLLLYVDDMIITGDNIACIQDLKDFLSH